MSVWQQSKGSTQTIIYFCMLIFFVCVSCCYSNESPNKKMDRVIWLQIIVITSLSYVQNWLTLLENSILFNIYLLSYMVGCIWPLSLSTFCPFCCRNYFASFIRLIARFSRSSSALSYCRCHFHCNIVSNDFHVHSNNLLSLAKKNLMELICMYLWRRSYDLLLFCFYYCKLKSKIQARLNWAL